MPPHFLRTSCPRHRLFRWWLTAPARPCESLHSCKFVCSSCLHSPLLIYLFFLPLYRTRGGFVALSPISPQELFLQPISSDVEASQPENPVSEGQCEQTTTTIIISSCHSDLLSFSWTDTSYTNTVQHCKLCVCCSILKGPLWINIYIYLRSTPLINMFV